MRTPPPTRRLVRHCLDWAFLFAAFGAVLYATALVRPAAQLPAAPSQASAAPLLGAR